MKNTLLLKGCVIAAAAVLLLTACRKTFQQHSTGKDLHFEGRSGSIMPTVKNGMLVFTDEDQLDAYIAYLDSNIASRPQSFDTTKYPGDTTDVDDRLDIWEKKFAYVSLRSVINANFEKLNDIGWTDVLLIPEDFYLHGSTVRSVYNANGDVQVGNTIQHLFNSHYDIMITDADLATLDRVDKLTAVDSPQLTNIFALDSNIVIFDRSACVPVKIVNRTGWKLSVDTPWKANFGVKWAGGTTCNKTMTYGVSSVSLVNTLVPATSYYHSGDKLDIYVDWGDGTNGTFPGQVIDIIPTSSGSGSGSTLTIEWPNTPGVSTGIPNHNYPAPGTYTMTVKVKRPYQGTYVASMAQTFTIPTFGCSNPHKSTSTYWKYTSDGSQAFSGQIIVDQNFWGHTYFEAETKGYIKKHGTYKHKKVERLVAQIWFNRYGGATPNPCDNFLSAEADGQWPYHEKTADAKRSGFVLNYDYWQTITSDHRLLYSGTYYDLTLTLNACQ